MLHLLTSGLDRELYSFSRSQSPIHSSMDSFGDQVRLSTPGPNVYITGCCSSRLLDAEVKWSHCLMRANKYVDNRMAGSEQSSWRVRYSAVSGLKDWQQTVLATSCELCDNPITTVQFNSPNSAVMLSVISFQIFKITFRYFLSNSICQKFA